MGTPSPDRARALPRCACPACFALLKQSNTGGLYGVWIPAFAGMTVKTMEKLRLPVMLILMSNVAG